MDWATRLWHELGYWPSAVFLTLTYDDEHLPPNDDLDAEALKLFWKRLRKRLGERKIKYYACGEYGSRYGRPHYHAIVFGLEPCGSCRSCVRGVRGTESPDRGPQDSDCELIFDAWGFGFVQVDDVTAASIRYVCGYIEKALYVPSLKGRVRPFARMSNGIGERYADENWLRLYRNKGDTVNGVPYSLPVYYRRKLGVPTELLKEWARERQEELEKHYVDRYGGIGVLEGLAVQNARAAHLRQSERNVVARLRRRERDIED